MRAYYVLTGVRNGTGIQLRIILLSAELMPKINLEKIMGLFAICHFRWNVDVIWYVKGSGVSYISILRIWIVHINWFESGMEWARLNSRLSLKDCR